MNDPTRDPPSTKFGGEARAGQTSTSTGSSTGGEGQMSPSYEGEDPFLGEGAHVVSGGRPAGDLGGDTAGGPSIRIDGGRNPNPNAGGDDLARSHGQDDDSVRTAEESRSTDDRHP